MKKDKAQLQFFNLVFFHEVGLFFYIGFNQSLTRLRNEIYDKNKLNLPLLKPFVQIHYNTFN